MGERMNNGILGQSAIELLKKTTFKQVEEENPLSFGTPDNLPMSEQEELDTTNFLKNIDLSLQGITEGAEKQIAQRDKDAGLPENFRQAMDMQGLSPRGLKKDFSKDFFDAGSFLEANDMEFVGVSTSPGLVRIRDLTSDDPRQVVEMNLKAWASTQGVAFDELDVAYNKPSNALNEAPVGMDSATRAKLAIGNARGNVKYLADKFEAVDIDPDNGMVVKEQGLWKRVDPSGIGQYVRDPYEFARDFADLADVAPYLKTIGAGAAVGSKLGAVAGTAVLPGAGTAVGGVAGGLAGAFAGGGATSLAISSLGRIVGTYDGTPQEQAIDAVIDGTLSLAGQGLVPGARATFGAVKSGLNYVAKNASPAVKNILAVQQGYLTGVGYQSARYMQDNSVRVMDNIKRFAKSSKDVPTIQRNIVEENNTITRGILERAVKGLSDNYGKGIDDILTSPEAGKLSVNFTRVIDDVAEEITEMGFGSMKRLAPKARPVKNLIGDPGIKMFDDAVTSQAGAKGLKDQVGQTAINNIAGKLLDRTAAPTKKAAERQGKLVFQALSPKQMAKRSLEGKNSEMIDTNPETLRYMTQLTSLLDGYSKIKTAKGVGAARALTAVQKQLNSLGEQAYSAKNYTAHRIITKVSTAARGHVGKQLDKEGLGQSYRALNSNYSKYANSVNQARRVLGNEGEEVLAKQLLASGNTSAKTTGMFQQLVELGGKPSEKGFEQMFVNSLSSAYSPIAPKLGLMQIGAIVGSVMNPAAIPGSAGLLAMSTPRVAGTMTAGFHRGVGAVSKTIEKITSPTKATLQMSGLLRGMGPKFAKTLLSDENAMNAFLKTSFIAGQDSIEQQMQPMLQDMGVNIQNQDREE